MKTVRPTPPVVLVLLFLTGGLAEAFLRLERVLDRARMFEGIRLTETTTASFEGRDERLEIVGLNLRVRPPAWERGDLAARASSRIGIVVRVDGRAS